MSAEDTSEKRDVVLVGPPTEDGEGVHALRSRPGRLDLAELRPAVEGRPLGDGELVRLDSLGPPRLYAVNTLYGEADKQAALPQGPQESRAPGPPKVSSDAFRDGWELVFGAMADSRERN